MPNLTGTIADVTGTDLSPAQIRQVFVKAPGERPSLADGGVLIVSAPVQLGSSGSLSVTLEPGPAVLTVDTYAGGPDVYDLYVTADMTLLSEAIDEAAPEHERSWSESVMVQLRDEAVAAAGRAVAAAGDVDDAIAGAAGAVVAAVESDRVAAEAAAGAAASSASDAAGSASAAAGSAATASQGAQVITDNLVAIEAAPGHAQAAQVARQGAEDARDAAAGSASSASGSASDSAQSAAAASGSASEAAGSASEAAGSASAAARSASDAAGSASGAASSAAAASGSATSAAGSARDAAGAVTDARAARDAAEGHATSAAGSAAAAASSATAADGHANRAEDAANSFDLTVTSSTLAPGAAATVTVSGDGPAYSLAFGVPQGQKGDKGDEGEISQAQLDAAVASLVDNAPEALNTLDELASALGDDPNFATTVSTQIGERAKTSDVNAALAGKADVGHTHPVSDVGGLQAALDGKAATSHTHSTAQVTGLDSALAGKASTSHTHPVGQLDASGTASSSTYLRGDGTWATPPDTTYSAMSQAEAENAASTTARLATGQRIHQAVAANPRLSAAPATWRWNGTTLPTAASQVHAQARVGDFIVAPNLTTDPGWHQITGV